jgi:hypothetical protein
MASALLFGQCLEDRLLDVNGQKQIELSKSERAFRCVLAPQALEIACSERDTASKQLIGYAA